MAQLPPKVPANITPNWPDFSHQKMEASPINGHHCPSWVDDFLDFSSARRGSHRRSMSDSIAFLEAPMVEECRRSSGGGGGDGSRHHHHNGGEFEGLDDEQLMSMFSDDVVGVGPAMSCASPSDHNSIDEEEKREPSDRMQVQPKSEPEEVASSCKSDGIGGLHAPAPENPNEKTIVDPKRIKRILANRQSAQRSRVRKLHYISELERSVTSLQAEVSVLSPRVAFLDHQRLVLNVDNSVLKQRIAALAQDKVFKDAHQEALKREIERLRQIYYQQNLKNMESNGAGHNSPAKVADTNCSPEKEQLAVN